MIGNLNNLKIKGRQLLVELVLFFAIISVAFFVVLNISSLFIIPTAGNIDGVTIKHVLADYLHLLGYLQNPFTGGLKFRYIDMSVAGRHHFADVKHLFLLNNAVMLISVPLTYWLLKQEKRKKQLWKLLVPLQIWLTVFPVLAVTLGLNFEPFFIKFHQIVFNNQDWIFDPLTDPIINVLTESVFIELAAMACMLIELMFFVAYRISKCSIIKS